MWDDLGKSEHCNNVRAVGMKIYKWQCYKNIMLDLPLIHV